MGVDGNSEGGEQAFLRSLQMSVRREGGARSAFL